MQYCIVEAVTAQELSIAVNEKIVDGWLPVGGVASIMDGGDGKLAQAMTRNA